MSAHPDRTAYPGLTSEHFRDARALADRSDMLLALRPQKGLTDELWGRRTAEIFGGRTHRAFYEATFAYVGDRLTTVQGESDICIAAEPDGAFDVIYVDADHAYDSVRRDARAAVPKMKPGGLLVFNDYTLHEHPTALPCGVVQAVNHLIVASDWKVVGFSLQREMYCDIALCRGEGSLHPVP